MYPATLGEPTVKKPLAAAVASFVAIMAIGPSSALAAAVTMVGSNGGGEHWGTAADWSNNQPAQAGNTYTVGSGFTLRTPTSNGPLTFPGDSLTLDGGQFNLIASFSSASSISQRTVVVNDLTMQNGGIIVAAYDDAVQYLQGNLHLSDAGAGINYIRTGKAATSTGGLRSIFIESLVSGGGTARLLQGGTIGLSNTGNTFAGTWLVGGSGGGFDSGSGRETLLHALQPGSLGVNASVTLDAFGRLDADYDWVTTGSLIINTNGQLILDQDFTVSALTVLGTAYGPGTYSFATLNGSHDAAFIDGGSGSITVVPEPATMSLLVVGGWLLGMGRRQGR